MKIYYSSYEEACNTKMAKLCIGIAMFADLAIIDGQIMRQQTLTSNYRIQPLNNHTYFMVSSQRFGGKIDMCEYVHPTHASL